MIAAVIGEILDELGGDAGVAGVARHDLGAGDDLAVRIQADVALVAIEAAGRGLVAVTGLRVDGGDHPVLGHPPGDPQGAVVALLQILADHGGQQLRRLAQLGAQLTALQQHQTCQRVAGPGVDQRLTGLGIVPVDLRLGCGGVVVTAPQHGTQLGFERLVGDPQQTPQRERISVTVSIVATASYSGVESNTRRAPTSPAADAASNDTRKIRFGSSEASSRARMSTSTVCANLPHRPLS